MKKAITILLTLCLAISMLVQVSAADAKTNITEKAEVGITYGLLSTDSYAPERLFDGIKSYNSADTLSYCDFKFASKAADAISDTAPKYNADGVEGQADSIYLCTFEVELDKLYAVDGFKLYGCNKGVASNIDGFDILVSETGDKGTWTKVYSGTELFCEGKYSSETENGVDTLYIETSFNAIKARYVVFGLTQYRCQHTEKLAALGLTANANPHYFRLSELEIYGGDVASMTTTTTAAATTTTTAAATTTTAKATTAAATTTTAKATTATTKAVTEAPKTADTTAMIVMAAACCLTLAAVVVGKRKEITK